MKKRAIFFVGLFMALSFSGVAHAGKQSPIYFNDNLVEFKNPVIRELSSTLVPVREFSEQAGYTVTWNGDIKEVTVQNHEVKVIMTIGNNNIQVQSKTMGDYDVLALLPPRINNSVTYVPLRAVVEALGAEVVWVAEDDSTHIVSGKKEFNNTFYSQYDPQYTELYNDEVYKWTKKRNGYCYVTSYAMLIQDLSGAVVTPKDIADINLLAGGNPSMCYHWSILEKYNRSFKKALNETSPYFVSYDSGRGLTYIDNSTPDAVIAALKESLDNNPKGVMVRDLSMPHTMVAVGYDEKGIYFNDPALQKGGVLWEETCLKNKEITTISAIIALK